MDIAIEFFLQEKPKKVCILFMHAVEYHCN